MPAARHFRLAHLFARRPSRRSTRSGAPPRSEPLEGRRLLSVSVVSSSHAEQDDRSGFFADFASDARPTEAYVSWGDGSIENLIRSRMIDYDPAADRGTVYGIHTYATPGRYTVTFAVKGSLGSMDSDTYPPTFTAHPLRELMRPPARRATSSTVARTPVPTRRSRHGFVLRSLRWTRRRPPA